MAQTINNQQEDQKLAGWHPGLGMLVARRIDGESQGDLAERLTRVAGKTWNQAKVSRLERGDTTMTTPELQIVARVQGRSYDWYIDGVNPGHLNEDSPNPHVARGSSIVTDALVEDWVRKVPVHFEPPATHPHRPTAA